MHTSIRPAPGEYAPFYAGYVARVPDGGLQEMLSTQPERLERLYRTALAGRLDHRYDAGKWSPREVLGHLADAERVMAYRALRIARGDGTPLAGFDENAFVAGADFGARSLESLLEEVRAVRRATLALLEGLREEDWARWGEANGSRVTVRALAWIVAGHVAHHEAILRERYATP